MARASNNLGKPPGQRKEPANKNAEAFLTRARDELDRLFAEFPGILQYQRELASIFNNLGRLGRIASKPSSRPNRSARLPTCSSRLATEYPQVPDYRQNLAIVQFQLNLLKARHRSRPARNPPWPRCSLDQEAPHRQLSRRSRLSQRPGPQPVRLWKVASSIGASRDRASRPDRKGRNAVSGGSESGPRQPRVQPEPLRGLDLADGDRTRIEAGRTGCRMRRAACRSAARPALGLSHRAAGFARCVKLASPRTSAAPRRRTSSGGELRPPGRRTAAQGRRPRLAQIQPIRSRSKEFVPLRTRQDFIELFKELLDGQTSREPAERNHVWRSDKF